MYKHKYNGIMKFFNFCSRYLVQWMTARYTMISGAKVMKHDVLAREWFYDLLTRPNMRIKVERKLRDIRRSGWIVGA